MDILSKTAERYLYGAKPKVIPLVLLITGMIVAVYCLVYFTGGIKFVYSHSMYIPIIFAALVFGVRGGIVAGIAGGLALGPYMPIDVITGEQQHLINWLYRTGFFTLIGAFTGVSIDLLRERLNDINWLMNNDQYTDLPNDQSLINRLDELVNSPDVKKPLYLLALGSSNITTLKNTFGFSVVHLIVQQMNKRLHETLLFNNGIFNHHVEQMAVILGGEDRAIIDQQINDIIAAMKVPFIYENIPMHIDVHVGGIIIDGKDTDADTLQRKVDIALNHAIDEKIDYYFYKEEEDKTSKINIGLLGSLNHAIESNQLILHYQPKIDIASKKLLGAEALIRWEHPVDGMIPPGNFIPQAEQTNLINPLTKWVVDKALSQMTAWDQHGFYPAVSINISTRNLHAPGFEDTIYDLLEKHSVPSYRLELEVTESALMKNPKYAIALLSRLANAEITISLDDFGTGYSSLEYLCKLPATSIKIDQYFVKNLSKDDGIKNIIESATRLAHSLDMTVVAEGVEDEESMNFLSDIGCDFAQGYFISRPVPEKELLAFALAN